ncbi:Rha family transcriptional regulator [Cupriavidus sp. D39]|uniref:Rha family transcriptional regulator n=1 Tax=Cupriavidus sp. D39 TaxID=2997877 RepID=UPI00227211CC|nr:Rha family transcriptional regulator [Cupriavidus sp. D39]MCY0858082.1 Rha family transcriptional regulator [Cupriavidus sp. D39]
MARPNTSSAIALVQLRGGVPVTDSLSIAREFGVRHDNVLRSLDSLISDGTISHLSFELAEYLDEQGKPRRAIQLTERGALIAMPFIGGRNSRSGQVRLVDAFLALRQQLTEPKSVGWSTARGEVAANYAVVSQMLAMRREMEGKGTRSHHYANEARLINSAFSGKPDPIDRAALSAPELHILRRLEVKASALIGMGLCYEERKAALLAYGAELRGQKAGRLAGGGHENPEMIAAAANRACDWAAGAAAASGEGEARHDDA